MINIEKPAQLKGYLIDRGLLLPNEAVAIEALAGGVSNRTMLVERESGEAWVIKQALAKLRTQADWFSEPIRIQREALALQWLPAITPHETIPRFVFADDDAHILAMSAVHNHTPIGR